mmetsp:Transcript_23388/g.38705  ORF Transcript_23388/g.38705 Transcript_23388/m.38705 type:complete len:338 (+) Transcript_23388:155-1168(+)|eukprot:CAMPEP_0119010738 /NCGR_PEP_ID=MMETSP1176-20130426/5218_1 /TAXON_ID=265551 /ORGANISM="Synedropsis recta cf, Strain CCMP1620" /LENGTH=337 /DNA_ID=CAMNT_0006963459 /DNA_START=151 /DNA_END=1164 /DNA_ORIENTATION=+
MPALQNHCLVLLWTLLLSLCFLSAEGFVPLTGIVPVQQQFTITAQTSSSSPFIINTHMRLPRTASSSLQMSSDGGGGKSALTAAGLVIVALLFFGGSVLPMMSGMSATAGGVAPLANSVANRDQMQQTTTNDKYRLSRSAIQEKLNTVPVFYVVGDKGEMGTRIYMSYNDAKDSAGSKEVVKATTLDQVEYPLVLRRGRMRMAPPPIEVQKAEDALSANTDTTYTLVPSKNALADAADAKLDLDANDFPIFVADRLAFGDPNGGLKVPLFLERSDCLTSYTRLRGSNLNMPETPNIRTTTLNDELFSMEKGTRPGMTQLNFYATAEDVNKAVDLITY